MKPQISIACSTPTNKQHVPFIRNLLQRLTNMDVRNRLLLFLFDFGSGFGKKIIFGSEGVLFG